MRLKMVNLPAVIIGVALSSASNVLSPASSLFRDARLPSQDAGFVLCIRVAELELSVPGGGLPRKCTKDTKKIMILSKYEVMSEKIFF